MDKKPHPAKFSNELLPVLAKYCYGDIIDVMGGTGKAGLLKLYNTKIKSVTINELEEEWAIQAKDNMVDIIIIGDARNLSGRYDCIVTSPPYGNRMADNFKPSKPDSMRRRYAGDLGRNPSAGSVCCSHFGRGYEFQMLEILSCVLKNIQHKRIVWNTSNFIRKYYRWEDVPKNPYLYVRPGRGKPSMAFLHKSAKRHIRGFKDFVVEDDMSFRSLCPQGFASDFFAVNR